MKGKKISDQVPESPVCPFLPCSRDFHVTLQAIGKLQAMLDTLMKWVDEIEPVDQPQRFGNVAFRTWLDKVKPVSRERERERGCMFSLERH